MWEVGGSKPSPSTVFIMKRYIFKQFQIRWKESFGDKKNPYLYRWMILFFNFSIRLHHWIRSDDKRYLHDHACNFISIVLKGNYKNVTEKGTFLVNAGSVWSSKAKVKHYLDIPKNGAWTILICGRPYNKWGFWVNGKMLRPWRYYKIYGETPYNLQ